MNLSFGADLQSACAKVSTKASAVEARAGSHIILLEAESNNQIRAVVSSNRRNPRDSDRRAEEPEMGEGG